MSNWQKVSELFGQTMDLAPAQRQAFLSASCPDNRILCEVERFIRLEERAEGFLSEPIAPPQPEEIAPGLEDGQVLANRYRIERQIGEGGMCGGVYAALDLRNGNFVGSRPFPQHVSSNSRAGSPIAMYAESSIAIAMRRGSSSSRWNSRAARSWKTV